MMHELATLSSGVREAVSTAFVTTPSSDAVIRCPSVCPSGTSLTAAETRLAANACAKASSTVARSMP